MVVSGGMLNVVSRRPQDGGIIAGATLRLLASADEEEGGCHRDGKDEEPRRCQVDARGRVGCCVKCGPDVEGVSAADVHRIERNRDRETEHPEAEPMFRSEGSELVKGSMLALTIGAILDFAGDRSGSFRMITCEVQSHDAYGTPRELFGEFFGVIADTLREILGPDWSPEIDEAWRKLLGEIDRLVTQDTA